MNVKVTSKEKSQEFCCADDFQVGQDGGLLLFRSEVVEGGTLKSPREMVAAYSAGSWCCVEKVEDHEEESSESNVSSWSSPASSYPAAKAGKK